MIRKPRERRYLHNIHISRSGQISIKYTTLLEKSFFPFCTCYLVASKLYSRHYFWCAVDSAIDDPKDGDTCTILVRNDWIRLAQAIDNELSSFVIGR